VDEARTVLERLGRIDALERLLLAELKALGPEAERWARRERDRDAARAAVELARRLRAP
jgi:hypothetical protein